MSFLIISSASAVIYLIGFVVLLIAQKKQKERYVKGYNELTTGLDSVKTELIKTIERHIKNGNSELTTGLDSVKTELIKTIERHIKNGNSELTIRLDSIKTEVESILKEIKTPLEID